MSSYALEGAQWASTNITWSFATSNYGNDASDPFSSAISASYQSAIQWALQQWSSVAPLTFTQVADTSDPNGFADIRIGFGDLSTASTGIIGQTNLLWDGAGHFVPDEVVRLEDPSQFSATPNGSGNYTYNGTSATLEQVALHEIGHALGLAHASDPNAVMYASVGSSNQTLDGTDIAGIQALYGAPASTPAPVAAPSPSDVIALNLSEDAWLGNAQFIVSLDGQQLSGVQTVTALHGLGQDQTFTFQGSLGAGAHDLAISFINDAWGGTPDTDRNLYIDSVQLDGTSVVPGAAALYSNGTAHFSLGSATSSAMLGGGSDNDATLISNATRFI